MAASIPTAPDAACRAPSLGQPGLSRAGSAGRAEPEGGGRRRGRDTADHDDLVTSPLPRHQLARPRPDPSRVARKASTAVLALPSTAGAATRRRRLPSPATVSSVTRAPGMTLTRTLTPPGTARTGAVSIPRP